MKTRSFITRLPLLLLALTLALVVSGCATRKIDWNARVSNYTFDQAVIELGPPAKQAKLTDGTTVAEWETQRGYTQTTFVGGTYGRRGYYGGYAGMPVTSTAPSYFIRLIFGADGQLQSWKKVVL